MLIKKYDYLKYNRDTQESGRTYVVDGLKIPSVTTVLSKTKDRANLDRWIQRVGTEEAERIKQEASRIGTEMHKYLEMHVEGTNYASMTPEGLKAKDMANMIIKEGLKHVKEAWGSETHLRYENLYAGTTDLIGIYKDKPAIIDFKQTNKPKRVEWIDDYFLQLAAYAEAHSKHYGEIEGGVILMCSRDLQFQSFEIFGDQMKRWKDRWWKKYEEYKVIAKSEQPLPKSEPTV